MPYRRKNVTFKGMRYSKSAKSCIRGTKRALKTDYSDYNIKSVKVRRNKKYDVVRKLKPYDVTVKMVKKRKKR